MRNLGRLTRRVSTWAVASQAVNGMYFHRCFRSPTLNMRGN